MFIWHILFLNFWSSFVYFSAHQRNIVCEYKLHGKHELVSNIDVEKNSFWNVKLKLLFFYLFFYLFFFLSRTFKIHRTAGEGGGYLVNSSLPLPPTSQTLRFWRCGYCRELTSAHRQQPDSNAGTFGFRVQVANH